MKANETDKSKRRKAIFDKMIKQLPPNNDQYYIQHDNISDAYRVWKEKKVTVIINSNEEFNSKAKKRSKKRWAIIPTGASLATGKIKENINKAQEMNMNYWKWKRMVHRLPIWKAYVCWLSGQAIITSVYSLWSTTRLNPQPCFVPVAL